MQNTRPYEKLKFYQDICEIRKFIYKVTERFKKTHLRLASQMQDAARSAKQNIREGYRKGSLGEFIHSIKISQGSLEELSGDVEDCKEDGLMNDEEFVQFSRLYQSAGYLTAQYLKSLYKIEREGSWKVPGAKLRIRNTATSRNLTQPHATSRNLNKGAALIIVIFAMMLFAMLGLTLANLQSGDFEMNLRAFNSEQAFNLAEAGQEWAIQQLVLDEAWRTQDTGADADCNDPGDWENYILSPGEYRVCCRNATASEQLIGNIVIESQGYIPSIAKPRSIRQTKLILDIGSFDKVLIAKDLFDWSLIHTGSTMNGNIQALNYKGDGDNNHNEPGIDYQSGASPLPPGTGKNTQRIVASTPFPAIDMEYYEAQAKTPSYKPLNEDNIWMPALTATISEISTDAGKTQLKLVDPISGLPFEFGLPLIQWNTQSLRNISRGAWQTATTWEEISSVSAADTVTLDTTVNWSVGERITVIPVIQTISRVGNTYTIDFSCDVFTPPYSKWKGEAIRNFSRTTSNDWPYSDWGVITDNPKAREVKVAIDSSINLDTAPSLSWNPGEWIGIVKRYNSDVNNNTLWYIMADALLDLRASNITFKKTSLIAEGDIAIKGTGNEKLHFTEKPSAYPNVATKNGNIISLDTPGTGNDGARRQRRDFDDLVYTENGTLNFNYLDARAAYGNNIIFDGEIKLKYDKKLERRLTGFIWGLSNAQWQEE